ncbi:MAG TPA: metallophosphoesterase [Steroidobacteraceae bacterium]|nr:metallophosphoesterase [Steroidobacteraceae bacterium]
MPRWPVFILALLLAVPAAGAGPAYRFTDVPRVVVFPDTHGAYEELVSLLRETAVVDDALRWRAGATHLVSLGDLLDRGPDSRKVLDLLMRLESEARQAGGAFHMVLGNHEVMNIVGDLRYVSAEEFASFAGPEDDALRESRWRRRLAQDPGASRASFDARFPPGYFAHRQAFSAAGEYGAWLLGQAFLITVNDSAFVHGGLPAMVTRLGLEATNQALHAQLADYLRAWESLAPGLPGDNVEFRQRPDAVAALGDAQLADSFRSLQDAEVFTTRGPTWYRGQALCNALDEADNLAAVLDRLGVERVVVGHTTSPTRRVATRLDGRVVMLDAGMLRSAYRGSPAALVFEAGRWNVAYADRPGERSPPPPLPRMIGARPAGIDDDALESWLAEAEVVRVEELAAGITNPQRVTLRKDGVELRAVFKQLSTDFGEQNRQKALDIADRFQFELAAYRLDRLLGLDMVPVTIPRAIDGRKGVLQFWIDGAINLRQMIEQKLQPEGWCPAADQYNLMNVFDVLIHNTDRTQENALFTRDWTLVLIDHSRAFATYTKNPRLLYLEEPRLTPALAARLQALDRPALQEALGPWLHRRQIDAILKRRDRLLDQHRARSAAGHDAVGQ